MKSGHMFTIGGKAVEGEGIEFSAVQPVVSTGLAADGFFVRNQFHRIAKNKNTRNKIGINAIAATYCCLQLKNLYTLIIISAHTM
jgi:hypothetical protein